MAENIADKLLQKIDEKGNPCCVGLDPVVESIPENLLSEDSFEGVGEMFKRYMLEVIDVVYELVPAVKLQIAFYEKYGAPGLRAFKEIANHAKKMGLIAIEDGKRNDISSTAQAYADGHLGRVRLKTTESPSLDMDMLTVNPYLGKDGLVPFVKVCKNYGKGIFILDKTSNPSSGDYQDRIVEITQQEQAELERLGVKTNGKTHLYNLVALDINRFAQQDIGRRGYSSIGAVVGATYKEQAAMLRMIMPNSIFLVPGYGAQGGTADDVTPCFNNDGYGAIVNSSRGITYAHLETKGNALIETRKAAEKMVKEIPEALKRVGKVRR